MSILIKGMTMPKNCLACPLVSGFTLWAEGKNPPTIDTRMCRIKREMKYTPDEEKPSWCPLIEVPKHGRLIDADALLSIWDAEIKALIDKGIEYCDGSWEDVYDSFVSDVKKIKTIIEAEVDDG